MAGHVPVSSRGTPQSRTRTNTSLASERLARAPLNQSRGALWRELSLERDAIFKRFVWGERELELKSFDYRARVTSRAYLHKFGTISTRSPCLACRNPHAFAQALGQPIRWAGLGLFHQVQPLPPPPRPEMSVRLVCCGFCWRAQYKKKKKKRNIDCVCTHTNTYLERFDSSANSSAATDS